jgi:hypothetical protein
MADNGAHIATAVSEGGDIAVSDCLFKDRIGTAAWVIKGPNKELRLMGQVSCLGQERDQSFHSELVGILTLFSVVKKICSFHSIQEGSIKIFWDGLSAVLTVFAHPSALDMDSSNHV